MKKEIREPILLLPALKKYLWGGDRLRREFAIGAEREKMQIAEAWVCSVHPAGESLAADGDFAGRSLSEVLRGHPEFLGERAAFPLLVKLIDAREKLSIQVHPTDEYAAAHEGGQRGKSEMWFILDAEAGATISFGLRRAADEEEIRQRIWEGALEDLLQKIPVRKGDVFYVPAGAIHAIGEGVLLAEVQESSDLTYRLYDYDRLDADGQKRPLQIEKALAVADKDAAPEPRQPMRVLRYAPGVARELLAHCPGFEVHRLLLRTEESGAIPFAADDLSFRVLLCVDGEGRLTYTEAEAKEEVKEKAKAESGRATEKKRREIPLRAGNCLFLPAGCETELSGSMELLDIRG